ncbi:hypothetical protein JCM14469_06580 [Desulfatiferula olefinivorans]
MRASILLVLFLLFMHAGLHASEPAPAATASPSPGVSASGPDAPGPEAMTDILDIKPPEDLGFNRMPLVIALGIVGLFLILALLFWLIDRYLKNRRKKEAAGEAPAPPDVLALSLLDALEKDGLDDARECYFRLTAIVKTYLDGRFGIDAPEMTSEELLPQLGLLPVDRELSTGLRELIRRSEPVKFAGLVEGTEALQADVSLVRRFVQQTPPTDHDMDQPDNG